MKMSMQMDSAARHIAALSYNVLYKIISTESGMKKKSAGWVKRFNTQTDPKVY